MQQQGLKIGMLCPNRDLLYPLFRRPKGITKETGIPLNQIRKMKGTHGAPTDYTQHSTQEIVALLKDLGEDEKAI